MAVRKFRRGKLVCWQTRVQLDGHRLSKTFRTKAKARAAEADLLQELRESLAAKEVAATQPATLREAFEAYLTYLESRGKSGDSVTRTEQVVPVLERVLPHALDRPISEFGEREVFAFRQARERAGIKPATINRDLRVLRALLRRVAPDFRFPGDAFHGEDETRVRWLRPDDERRVFAAMRSPFREIAKLAALTLMRMGEILRLRREDVHLEQGVILLPRAKAGARPVVLNQEAKQLLRDQLARHDSPLVFPNPEGRPWSRVHVSRAFRRAARGVGLNGFRFHDLRHHGATMALNAGFTAPIVMALGGWKSERMMRRYAAVTDATLRAAAEAVSGNGHGPGRNSPPAGGAPGRRVRTR